MPTRIPVIHNKNYKPHGLKSYVYALNKYAIKPTQAGPYQHHHGSGTLQKTLADGTAHAVAATDVQNDSLYICPVQIGTPAQTLNLDFDSGSSDLWVWSDHLPSATQATGKKNGNAIFHSKKSSTFKNMQGSTWQISYGDGSSASGTVGTDNVKVGDITIKAQAIELASKLSDSFTSGPGSGLLGLAWPEINTVKPTPVKPPVQNMIAQNDIAKNEELFTVYLGSVKDVNDPDKGQSFYTFGAIDETVVKASGQQIAYTPVDNSQGFWMFDSESMTINGKTVALSGNKAIADTGTTLALVSDDVCKQIYGAIDGATYSNTDQGYIIPADNISARPQITFAVGNTQFAIEKEQLGWSPVDTKGSNGQAMLYGAIQSRGSLTFDILGDTFLICVYAVFDVGNKRFGCVQRPDPTPAGSS